MKTVSGMGRFPTIIKRLKNDAEQNAQEGSGIKPPRPLAFALAGQERTQGEWTQTT